MKIKIKQPPRKEYARAIHLACKEFLKVPSELRMDLESRFHHISDICVKYQVKLESVYRIIYGSGGNEHAEKR